MAVKSLIETVTVGAGGAASIEFTAIPQNGSDLILVISGRTARTGTTGNLQINVNSDTTASNYSNRQLYANNGTVYSFSANEYPLPPLNASSTTANTFSSHSVYISNYTSSNAKSMSLETVTENNSSAVAQDLQAATWSGTSAITSIQLKEYASFNFDQYTTASLYKIKYD